MNASFDYILRVNTIRQEILKKHPERPPPSWIRITTITMCSKFLQEIDLQKFKENFAKLGSVTVRRQGSRFRGFEWKMKDTAFYNQVTIGYEDQYSRKSIKIFPNGSIQVAGCSDLFDCRRILHQLSFILKVVLELESDAPIGDISVKMINTNFSLNSSVNLNKIIAKFSSTADQARINYLDERINFMKSIYNQDGYAMGEEVECIIPEKKAELSNLIAERQSLGDKAPDGKFKVTFDPDRYSAVKLKFTPREGQKQVTASIFSTGKIIVTGAQTLDEIAGAYELINNTIDASILVKPVAEPELFETIMGARFEEWVRVLNKTVVNKM